MAARRGGRLTSALADQGVLPAGTKVHVDAKLYGVKFGDDSFGASDSTLDFEIGRRQVVKADATSHRIQVITDEGVTMDFPCSYGEATSPPAT